MTDHRTTVLIPAAGRVPEQVLAFSNVSCTAMIPVAGRPVVHWTLRYLNRLGCDRFRIAVPAPDLFVEEYVRTVFGQTSEVEFTVPDPGGLARTIAELAAGVTTESALVVLGDTNFEFADPATLSSDEVTVLVDRVDESYRWCIAEHTDGVLTRLHDKVAALDPPLDALIGVYWFPDVGLLRRAAAAALESAGPGASMADVLERVATEVPIRVEHAGQWLDCGNPDRQAASQRTLLQERAFNELSVDETLGTITKRSTRPEKFIDEINYLRLLPADLSVLFPRLIDFSTAWDDPYVTMEFYGYPTLSELFVFENVDPSVWHRVFLHLDSIVRQRLMRHRRPIDPVDVHQMFLGKVLARAEELGGPPELVELMRLDGDIEINGRTVGGLTAVRDAVDRRVEQLAKRVEGSVIHGDLCFSNILYDLRAGIAKLLDPRGSFGKAGIYGDPRYDIAKLHHSVHGAYDFITADLFDVSLDGRRAELRIHRRPYHDEIGARFDEVFFASFDRSEITLICGLIFLGLPALHYDAPRRQIAFYLRGLELIDEALATTPDGG